MRNSVEKKASKGGSPDFQKIVFRRSLSRELQQLLRRLMKTSPFFSGMDERDAIELLRFCRVRKIPAIHPVFLKGDVGDGFYIIVSGRIVIELDGGQEYRLEAGEVFGGMALVRDLPHSVKAWADENAVLLCVPRFVLETGFCSLRAKIYESLAKQLAENLRRSDLVIENFTKTSRSGM